jgi:hypothetical protein
MRNSIVFRSLVSLAAAIMIFCAAVYFKGAVSGNASAAAEAASGSADTKTSSTGNSSVSAPDGQPAVPGGPRENDDIRCGRVMAIDGSEVTVALGAFSGSTDPGNMPRGRGRGDWHNLALGGEFTASGETKTVTVTESVSVIIRGADAVREQGPAGSAASLADITVGSLVMLTYTAGTDTLLALEILGGFGTAL